jgi:hypothetical protein
VHRAAPLAVRVAAVHAAGGLTGRLRGIERLVNLVEVPDALLGRLLVDVARHFEVLQRVLAGFRGGGHGVLAR